MCCCCPLLAPFTPSPRQRSSPRELCWLGWLTGWLADWPAPMSAIVGAESRRRHSSSPLAAAFAFVRIRFATFRRSFQFSFCLNKKILNLIFLRVSCSLTISESLSRMRVADFALLFTLCCRLCLYRRTSSWSSSALVCVYAPTVCVFVCVRVG